MGSPNAAQWSFGVKKTDQSLERPRRLVFVEKTAIEDGAAQKAPDICKRVSSDLWPSTDLLIHERKR